MVNANRTLADFFATLETRGDVPFLVRMGKNGKQQHTYTALAAASLGLARGLYQQAKTRTRTGILAEPGFESIAAALGVIRSGGSVLLIDIQAGDRVLKKILSDSDIRLVFTTSRHAERLKAVAPQITLAILDPENGGDSSWKNFFSMEGALPDPASEDEAVLFYTSGTTGPPKGVPLNHENLMFQLDTVSQTGLISEKDVTLLPLPLHHVYPFVIGILVPLSMGLTIVLPDSLTGPQILRAVKEAKVTVILGVPRLYSAVFSGIRDQFRSKGFIAENLFDILLKLAVVLCKNKLSTGRLIFRPLHEKIGPDLKILASGGSFLEPELAWKLKGLGWNVAIGYGLTETSPLLTINPPGSGRVKSIGTAIEGMELRFDPSALPDGDGEKQQGPGKKKGEILAKGPGVFSGYLNMPEKTAEAFADGWFKTGDLGYQDDAGYVYVTGRVSTLIVTRGGENIQPDQLEKALEEHPVISEAGVLQKQGKLTALLVPDSAKIIKRQADDIREVIGEAVRDQSRKMPSYQRIEDFAITRETLPRTRLGKIKRHILENRYASAIKQKEETPETGPIALEKMSDQDRLLLGHDAVWHIWEWLGTRFQDHRLTPDTSLRLDLGVDSMEWLNLTMEIREKSGVELTDESIQKIDIVRDLLQEVKEASRQETMPASLEEPEKIIPEQQKKFIQPLKPGMQHIAAALFKINRMLMRLLFRVKTNGLENIPEGRVVFTPNHVSYLDPFILAAALKNERLADTFWVGYGAVTLHNPFNRMMARLAKTIPIDPVKGVFSSIASAALVLKRGNSLIWFPEGMRSPSGKLQPFRQGIGVLLEHYEVPVVPVFIKETGTALSVGSVVPKPVKVMVTFGEPVFPEQLKQSGKAKTPRDKITEGLHTIVAEMGR
jgi:long-chain acyl-CoA synthetase